MAALLAALALAAPAVSTPTPAAAALLLRWSYDARPPGMPTTDVPALTLVSASSEVWVQYRAEVVVTAELGAEPGPDTDADLHVALGTLVAGVCEPEVEVVVPTLDPGSGGVRDGTRITAHQPIEPYTGDAWDCSWAWLTPPRNPIVLDRLDGHRGDTWAVDYRGYVPIAGVAHRRLPPGRWSYVDVRLRNRGYAVDRLVVRGRGRGLTVGVLVMTGDFPHGEVRDVQLPVRLDARRPRRLTLTTVPGGHDIAFPQNDEVRVTVRPRR